MTALSFDGLRAEFPTCAECAYFYSGAQAPLAHAVRNANEEFLRDWRDLAWRMEFAQFDHFERAQHALGSIVSCDSSRVIPCEGTSHGLNIATSMVIGKWQRDCPSAPRNVVFHQRAHAAGSYPWLNAIRLGAAIEPRWAIPEAGESHLDAIKSRVDDETLAVVTTHVCFRTGERLDVVEVANAFPDRSWALIVDAAQSAGALPLKGEAAVCDFISLPSYKWLFGPPGVGFLVSRASWIEDPGPPAVGWCSVLPLTHRDPTRMIMREGAAAFRLGQPNHQGMAGAAAALELASHYPAEAIAARIRELTETFVECMEDLGIPVATPTHWNARAGIICLDMPNPDRLMEELHSEGIEVGVVPERLRVDIHAFNNASDLDRITTALEASVRRPRR
jgi:selenocysteine lyase/cysteine desulfurase